MTTQTKKRKKTVIKKERVREHGQHYWIKEGGRRVRVWRDKDKYDRDVEKNIFTKEELERQFASRGEKSKAIDLSKTAKNTLKTPVVTGRAKVNMKTLDVAGIDTKQMKKYQKDFKSEIAKNTKKKANIAIAKHNALHGNAGYIVQMEKIARLRSEFKKTPIEKQTKDNVDICLYIYDDTIREVERMYKRKDLNEKEREKYKKELEQLRKERRKLNARYKTALKEELEAKQRLDNIEELHKDIKEDLKKNKMENLEEIELAEKQVQHLTNEMNTFSEKYGDYMDHTPEERKRLSKMYAQLDQQRRELKKAISSAKHKTLELGKNLIEANPDDIDPALANRAFSNTSWTPERRGESARKAYAQHVNEFHDEMYKAVPISKHHALKEALESYQRKYKEKIEEQLYRHSSMASSAVVGRSKFPVGSQNKKQEVYQRKQQELFEWDAKVKNSIRRQFGLAGGKGISSDDKDAVTKIGRKIHHLQQKQEFMKQSNKIVRSKSMTKAQKEKELKDLGHSESQIHDLFKEDFAGRNAYPSYLLSNNNANIRRLQQRQETLEKQRSTPTSSKEIGGVEIEDNAEENRLKIHFGEKPDDATIAKLKANGFRYAYKTNAWQRNRSERANYLAKEIVEDYNEKKKKERDN